MDMDKSNNSQSEGQQGNVALLVIDVQQGIFERPTPIYKAAQLVENITMLIHKARQAGAAVFFVQHTNKSSLAKGSDAWQLHFQLQPLDTDVFVN